MFVARLRGDHGAHRPCAQHLCHDRAPMRKIGTDADGALSTQDAAQDAGHAPRLIAHGRGIEQRAQADRLAHLHHDVAAVDQHGEKLAHARRQSPVLGEQQAQPRALFLRRASPVHRGGHQQYVAHGVGAQGLDQREQIRRRTARLRGVPEAAPAGHVEVGTALFHRQAAPALLRIRQPRLAGHIAQHREVGHRVALEHVTDRHARRRQRRRRLGGLHGGPNPELEESSQQPAHAFTRATRRMMLGAGV